MFERKRKLTGAAEGASPPPSALPGLQRRRILASPANDNRAGGAQRLLRAVIFVAIGAAVAWALHLGLG